MRYSSGVPGAAELLASEVYASQALDENKFEIAQGTIEGQGGFGDPFMLYGDTKVFIVGSIEGTSVKLHRGDKVECVITYYNKDRSRADSLLLKKGK